MRDIKELCKYASSWRKLRQNMPVNEWGKQLRNSLHRKVWSPQYLLALVFTGSTWPLNIRLIWEGEGWSTAKDELVKAYWERLDIFKSTGQAGFTRWKLIAIIRVIMKGIQWLEKGSVSWPPLIKRGRMTKGSTAELPLAHWEGGRLHHGPWSQFPTMWGTKM